MRNQQGRPIRAGGSILAGTILLGTIVGAVLRQSSIGFLVGAGVGLTIVILIWLKDRAASRP